MTPTVQTHRIVLCVFWKFSGSWISPSLLPRWHMNLFTDLLGCLCVKCVQRVNAVLWLDASQKRHMKLGTSPPMKPPQHLAFSLTISISFFFFQCFHLGRLYVLLLWKYSTFLKKPQQISNRHRFWPRPRDSPGLKKYLKLPAVFGRWRRGLFWGPELWFEPQAVPVLWASQVTQKKNIPQRSEHFHFGSNLSN